MDPGIKTFILVLLLIFSSARAKGTGYGVDPANLHNEVIIQENVREPQMVDIVLDYEKAGPNPRHDKGKPGTNP
ncbi:hypothetical protein F0562_007785 [Nyssa sinensis]|uniref:Neprosin activation peptide domain-containing protein n=1 Tax=Nyssa sinensis TaxID=561372 RepID=A0A5J5A4U4_9ASTE|nr:hypothetical protein F0562_007785 [Nyssa sinensis]